MPQSKKNRFFQVQSIRSLSGIVDVRSPEFLRTEGMTRPFLLNQYPDFCVVPVTFIIAVLHQLLRVDRPAVVPQTFGTFILMNLLLIVAVDLIPAFLARFSDCTL